MAYALGANDAANSMASAVGAKAITMRQAIFIAGIANFVGAAFLGAAVTSTVAKGIIDPAQITDGNVMALGMFAALLAAGLFVLAATLFGLPVSSTHAIVGAIAGFGVLAAGWGVVQWDMMLIIVIGWVATPFVAALISLVLALSIRRSLGSGPKVAKRILEVVPIWMALVAIVVVLFLLEEVFPTLEATFAEIGLLAIVGALIVYILGFRMLVDRHFVKEAHPEESVQESFSRLQIFTSAYISLAHGANDVANAFGPVLAIYLLAQQGFIPADAAVPLWVLVVGGAGIALGIGTIGPRVIETVGNNLTKLDNVRGFSADFTIATTVMGASQLGLPVSSSHAAVGAITGTGLASGKRDLNLRLLGKIFVSWILTVPIAALVTMGIYLVLEVIFLG
ncbi:MAG: inorganic phosphate transporter [Pseudomonadota bacterium]